MVLWNYEVRCSSQITCIYEFKNDCVARISVFFCTFAAVKQVKVYNIVCIDGDGVKRN
jgi:hypothetical protein